MNQVELQNVVHHTSAMSSSSQGQGSSAKRGHLRGHLDGEHWGTGWFSMEQQRQIPWLSHGFGIHPLKVNFSRKMAAEKISWCKHSP